MPDTSYSPTRVEFTCTSCQRPATVTIEYALRRDAAGKVLGEVTQFRCPHCDAVFPSTFTTARGLRYREQLAAARARLERMHTAANVAEVQRLQALVQAESSRVGLARGSGQGEAR